MNLKENSVIDKWCQEVWNKGNRNAIDLYLHPELITHGLAGGDMTGIEAYKAYYDGFLNDFKDVSLEAEEILIGQNMEAVTCTATATHIASGKQINIKGMMMVRLENGKVIEAWNQFDFMTLYSQLGYSMVLETAVAQ